MWCVCGGYVWCVCGGYVLRVVVSGQFKCGVMYNTSHGLRGPRCGYGLGKMDGGGARDSHSTFHSVLRCLVPRPACMVSELLLQAQ